MDFSFPLSKLLPDHVTVFTGGKSRLSEGGREKELHLQVIIDAMGAASAKAQGLKGPITSYSKFLHSKDQTLYLLRENDYVVGFIKTGKRRLFLWDHNGLIHEVVPLCVLDFYVHETQQRKGHGKHLFEQVLQREQVQPFEVAIDRPSVKFLNFLHKHYSLHSHIKQNNNYVVFKKFFSTCDHYDYGQRANRRRSLPSKMESVTPLNSGRPEQNNHRLSLSPNRFFATIPEDKPSIDSFHSLSALRSKENDVDVKTDVLHSNILGVDNTLSPEQVSWSEAVKPVNPVPGSRHAPFLTLRGLPRQQQNYHSIYNEAETSGCGFKGAYTLSHRTNRADSNYSKYEVPGECSSSARLRPPYATANSLQRLKKQPWKDHLY